MADQQIPPEMLAALQAQNGGAPMPPVEPRDQVDPAEVTTELLRAVKRMADLANTAEDSREATEAAKAALAFAQAIVVLDPNLAQDGSPLEHQIRLEQERATGQLEIERQRGQNAIEQAKAAPTPVRSISVKRDGSGRASGYTTEG